MLVICSYSIGTFIAMYNGLFSHDLHILNLYTHYILWKLPLCALVLCSMTHYDITMGHNIASRDALL